MSAFQDSHTKVHGSVWSVEVEPVLLEQITTAASYLSINQPERAEFVEEYRASAEEAEASGNKEKQKEVVLELIGKAKKDGIVLTENPTELDSLSSLITSVLLSLFPESGPEFVEALTTWSEALASPTSTEGFEAYLARYSALINLFNTLPSSPSGSTTPSLLSALKLSIFKQTVNLAISRKDFDVIQPLLDSLRSWVEEWRSQGVEDEKLDGAVKEIVDGLVEQGQSQRAYTLLFSHLAPSPSAPIPTTSSTNPSSQSSTSASLPLSTLLLSLAISNSDFYDFEPLQSIPGIQAIAVGEGGDGKKLWDLLEVYLKGDVKAFKAWEQKNGDAIKTHSLDSTVLLRKARVLSLVELASEYVGGRMSYDQVAKCLELEFGSEDDEEDKNMEIESWVIEAIRSSMISARLNQPTRTILINRASTTRALTVSNWQDLEKKLLSLRNNLSAIIKTVGTAVVTVPVNANAAPKGGAKVEDEKTGGDAVAEAVPVSVSSAAITA